MSDEPRLTREALYEEVWKTPIYTLAKQFGMSGRGLAKLCARDGIPVPPRGYWARLKAGKQLRRPPLGPRQSRTPWSAAGTLKEVPESARKAEAEQPFSAEIAELLDRVAREPGVELRTDLRGGHPIVRAEAERIARERKHRTPWSEGDDWSNAQDALEVSERNERRALFALDALARELASLGVKLTGATHRGLAFDGKLAGVEFRLWVVEKFRQEERPHSLFPGKTEKRFVHAGQLQLGFDFGAYSSGRVWTDGPKRIEQRLTEAVPKLLKAVDRRLRQQNEWDRARREREQQERRVAAAEAERRAELQRRKDLLDEAAQWRSVIVARAYVRAVERQAAPEGGAVVADGPVTAWVAWARAVLDSADPARRRLDSLQTAPPAAPVAASRP